MAVQPGQYDMQAQRHASYTCTLATSGLPTHYNPSMQIRFDNESTGSALITLSSSQIAWSGTDLVITLSKTDIESLPLAVSPEQDAIFRYDIRLTAGSNVMRILEGQFIVHAGVTRDA